MGRNIFLFLGIFVLISCSPKQAITIEEDVLMKSFASYYAALAFDEVCNGGTPKERYDMKQKKNAMLLGNEQMLAGRLGGLWHIRHPEKSVDEGVKYLLGKRDQIEEKAREIFKTQGCQSDRATAAARAYKVYSEAHPAIIMSLIDREIEKQGGTITPPEDIEAAGKKGPPN